MVNFTLLSESTSQIGDVLETVFTEDLPLFLAAIGVFGFFIVLALLASIFLHRVLRLIGVPSHYVALVLYLIQPLIALIGAYAALRTLGLTARDVLIVLSLFSVGLGGALASTFANLSGGIAIRSTPHLQVGREASVAEWRGIVALHGFFNVTIDVTDFPHPTCTGNTGNASTVSPVLTAVVDTDAHQQQQQQQQQRKSTVRHYIIVPNIRFSADIYGIHTHAPITTMPADAHQHRHLHGSSSTTTMQSSSAGSYWSTILGVELPSKRS